MFIEFLSDFSLGHASDCQGQGQGQDSRSWIWDMLFAAISLSFEARMCLQRDDASYALWLRMEGVPCVVPSTGMQ